MSDAFASQLNAFRKSVKNSSTTLPSQRRVIDSSSSSSSPTTTTKSPTKSSIKRSVNSTSVDFDDLNDYKRSKLNDDDEDGDVNSSSNLTSTLSIRLMTASDIVKSSDRPVSIYDLEKQMKMKIDPKLIKCLANVDRIKYDPVNKTLEYLSLHNIKTAEDLLKVLESQPTFQGLSVKQLKDGWNACLPTIAKLEKESKIIVHKTKKENSPRHIWLNLGNIQVGNIIEPEFYDMWGRVKVPKGDDLVLKLLDNGLKPTNADLESIQKNKALPMQERKQKKPRKGKVTNTHMKGILKDYSRGML